MTDTSTAPAPSATPAAAADPIMNVYRVNYVYRASMGSSPIEKVAFVFSATDQDAVAFINAIDGNEVMGAATWVQNVLDASASSTAAAKPAAAPVSTPHPSAAAHGHTPAKSGAK